MDPFTTTAAHIARRATRLDARHYPRICHPPVSLDPDMHRDELDALRMDADDAELQALIDGVQWVDTTDDTYPYHH